MRYCPSCKRMVNARRANMSNKRLITGAVLGGVFGVGVAQKTLPMECPICGLEIYAHTSAPNQRTIYCYYCGVENPYGTNFCSKCGKKLR